MDRRKAIKLVAAALAAPALSRDLFALGQQVHARLPSPPQLRVFTPHQDATVATMAELIIPATDTPGARAARVNEFIDFMIAEWFVDRDRQMFLSGLDATDRRCRELYGKDFVACTQPQQAAVLTALDHEVARMRETLPYVVRGEWESSPVPHFFFILKRFTLVGYYTSQIGAEQELHYQVIPGTFRGCVPLERPEKAVQKSELVSIAPPAAGSE